MSASSRPFAQIIFEAHPSIDRDGAIDFDELLDLRASHYRNARSREESALANISDQIGIEMEKTAHCAAPRIQGVGNYAADYLQDRRA